MMNSDTVRHSEHIRTFLHLQRKSSVKNICPRPPHHTIWPLAPPLAKCGDIPVTPRGNSGATLFSGTRSAAADKTRQLLWGAVAAPEAQRFRTPLARPLGSLLSRDVSLDAMRFRTISRQSYPRRPTSTPLPMLTDVLGSEGGGGREGSTAQARPARAQKGLELSSLPDGASPATQSGAAAAQSAAARLFLGGALSPTAGRAPSLPDADGPGRMGAEDAQRARDAFRKCGLQGVGVERRKEGERET